MSVFSVNPLPTFDLILLQMFAKFSFAIMPKEEPAIMAIKATDTFYLAPKTCEKDLKFPLVTDLTN